MGSNPHEVEGSTGACVEAEGQSPAGDAHVIEGSFCTLPGTPQAYNPPFGFITNVLVLVANLNQHKGSAVLTWASPTLYFLVLFCFEQEICQCFS